MMKLIAELKRMTQNRNCHAVYVTQAKNGMQNAKSGTSMQKKGMHDWEWVFGNHYLFAVPYASRPKMMSPIILDDTEQSGYQTIPAYHCVKIVNTSFRLVQSWYLWFSGSSSWWIFRVWNRNPKPSGLQIVSVLFLLLLGTAIVTPANSDVLFFSHPSVWHWTVRDKTARPSLSPFSIKNEKEENNIRPSQHPIRERTHTVESKCSHPYSSRQLGTFIMLLYWPPSGRVAPQSFLYSQFSRSVEFRSVMMMVIRSQTEN